MDILKYIITYVFVGNCLVLATGQRGKNILTEIISQTVPYKNKDGVIYYLYTRNNPQKPINLNSNWSSLNSERPVKLIIHGFTENAFVQWYKDMIDAYLKRENCNIIAVDWSERSKPLYTEAVKATRQIGIAVGNLLLKLKAENKIKLQSTHIIGHSLGAHVAGFAGKQVFRVEGDKIARITGLDPAGPLFEVPLVGSDTRIDKGDAKFVDIIHTDGGILGFKAPIGHADFFPNGGGARQPGCDIRKLTDLKEYFCSHIRCHQLFIESMQSEDLRAKPCPSWIDYQMGSCNNNSDVPFGENAMSNITGNFYLRTNARPPYSMT